MASTHSQGSNLDFRQVSPAIPALHSACRLELASSLQNLVDMLIPSTQTALHWIRPGVETADEDFVELFEEQILIDGVVGPVGILVELQLRADIGRKLRAEFGYMVYKGISTGLHFGNHQPF